MAGRNPNRVIMSRHNSIPADCLLLTDGLPVTVSRSGSVAKELERLYAEGTTSVLVEGEQSFCSRSSMRDFGT